MDLGDSTVSTQKKKAKTHPTPPGGPAVAAVFVTHPPAFQKRSTAAPTCERASWRDVRHEMPGL